MDNTSPFFRRIRSFVRREGRITPKQLLALDTLWPRYGIEVQDGLLDLDQLFHRSASRILEIGFGMGQSLVTMAIEQPQYDYIGIEVHRPGVGTLLSALAENKLEHVRLFCADAIDVLESCIPDQSLDKIQLFFPDPWPKKRHEKRRILQPLFVELIHRKLKNKGQIHMATDWEAYAIHMMKVMSEAKGFVNAGGRDQFMPRPCRPVTKFEQRGQRLGHTVWDLVFVKEIK